MPYDVKDDVDLTNATMADVNREINKLGRAFAEFTRSLDDKIKAQMKDHGVADFDDKLGRISDAMDSHEDELTKLKEQAVLREAQNDMENTMTPEMREYQSALQNFMRTGNTHDLQKTMSEMKISSDADGGYTVDDQFANMIHKTWTKNSPMRACSTVISLSSLKQQYLIARSDTAGGWGVEGTGTPPEGTPDIAQTLITAYKIWAEPKVTEELLADSEFNMQQFLSMDAARTFLHYEGDAFINGAGTTLPKGILREATVLDTSRVNTDDKEFRKIGYVKSGAAAGFPTPAANKPSYYGIIDLQESMQEMYTADNRDCFVMSKPIRAEVRKMTDKDNVSIWEPSLQMGVPSRLLGTPVLIADHMPRALAANAFPIAYVTPSGFTIAERQQMGMLVDRYTQKGFVKFYFTRRIGAAVTNFEAIKLLKLEA